MTVIRQILLCSLIFTLSFNLAKAEEISDVFENETGFSPDSIETEESQNKSDESSWFRVDDLGKNSNQGDFVIGPGKIEVNLVPGESVTREISITNRISDNRVFEITVEDVTGSYDEGNAVTLLGDEKGPYTLKDYISIPDYKITLDLGERAWIPITISIPPDAEPGGRYGSVLISTIQKSEVEGNAPNAPIIARVGTLFFVSVAGETEEAGSLKKFETKNEKKWFSDGPIDFRILFENTGSIHLKPFGEIKIKNLFGEEVGFVEIAPNWFILPKSLRSRDIAWDRELLFGRYTATISIDRGYDGIVDEGKVVFWVLPWKMLTGFFLGIFIIIFFLRYIFRNFEFKRKT